MSEDIKLIEDPEDIHLNENREIQQILGDPPGWILRWGILLVFMAVAVLILLSWLIKFPDVITVPFVLTTENPPIEVVARTNGKIKTLPVEPKTRIKQGDLLAIMENTADKDDVLLLEKEISSIGQNPSLQNLLDTKFSKKMNIGTIQPAFAQFSKSLEELRYVFYQNNSLQQIAALEGQINQLRSLNQSLENQKKTLGDVVDLAQQNLKRNEELFTKKVASQLEVENANTELLRSRQQLENMNAEIINNQLRIEQLSYNIIQIKQVQKDQQFPKYFIVQEDLQRLKNEIEQWKERFLIFAPISGQVEMDATLSVNQYLNESDVVLTIVPDNASNTIKSKGFLPFDGAGKVFANKTPANLRFNAYPFKEFGIIRTKVSTIAEVPQPQGYLVEFEIPKPLITTYDREIPFRQGMQGSARLVTKDRRILERIFDRIISARKNADAR